MKHFARYDGVWKRKPNNPVMKEAERILAKAFSSVGMVEPIDLNYAGWCDILPNLEMTSSPGLPLRREFSTQAQCLGHIYDKAKRLNHFAKFLKPPAVRAPPCMIGLRPGLTNPDELDIKVKARGVWAYPAEVKVVEQRFVIPLMKRLSATFGRHPYTMGVNMTKALPMVIDHLLQNGKTGMVTDVSHLDDSVGPDWIHWAFAFLERFFCMGMTKSSIERNVNVWAFLKYYFVNTPILLPSGQLVRKAGGVPSGSGFTQLIDTLVTLLAGIYSMLQMGVTEDQILGHIFAVGDDFAVSVNATFDKEMFCSLMSGLGFEINQSKVMFSDKGIDLKYLGYSKLGGFVFRSTEEFLKSAFFPEKFVGSANRSRQRLLGQLIAGGMSNSGFGKLIFKMYESNLFLPPEDVEVYLPQKRWLKHVLSLEEVPESLNAFDLFRLV